MLYCQLRGRSGSRLVFKSRPENEKMHTVLEAMRLKGKIGSDRRLELPGLPPELPEGEVELILLYEKRGQGRKKQTSPLDWPTLDGGRYLGGMLRREEIYGNSET
jgi:hypothetical protein